MAMVAPGNYLTIVCATDTKLKGKKTMKKILITALKEAIRVGLAAFLAAIGVNSSGCIASGNNSSAAFAVSGK